MMAEETRTALAQAEAAAVAREPVQPVAAADQSSHRRPTFDGEPR